MDEIEKKFETFKKKYNIKTEISNNGITREGWIIYSLKLKRKNNIFTFRVESFNKNPKDFELMRYVINSYYAIEEYSDFNDYVHNFGFVNESSSTQRSEYNKSNTIFNKVIHSFTEEELITLENMYHK